MHIHAIQPRRRRKPAAPMLSYVTERGPPPATPTPLPTAAGAEHASARSAPRSGPDGRCPLPKRCATKETGYAISMTGSACRAIPSKVERRLPAVRTPTVHRRLSMRAACYDDSVIRECVLSCPTPKHWLTRTLIRLHDATRLQEPIPALARPPIGAGGRVTSRCPGRSALSAADVRMSAHRQKYSRRDACVLPAAAASRRGTSENRWAR